MPIMKPIESQLKSFTPRRPSKSLSHGLFGAPQDSMAPGLPLTPWRYWLVPAVATWLLLATVPVPRSLNLEVSAGNLYASALSNDLAVIPGMPASQPATFPGLTVVQNRMAHGRSSTLEWTNAEASPSTMGFVLQSKATPNYLY